MDFKEYLSQELKKPIHNKDYDPDGNSDRAIVTRGFLREILWQYKAYPGRLKSELMEFNGLSTELGWLLMMPIMILFFPILPILAARYWHNKSINTYKIKFKINQS